MRNNILITLLLAFSLTACVEEDIDYGSSKVVGNIKVSFQRNGTEVGETVALTALGRTVDFDVILNDDNVKWNVASDQSWCEVVQEEHRGTGKFTLNILPNDSFESRQPATITFSAGEYSIIPFHLTQSGNEFIFSKSYVVTELGGTSTEIEVRTLPEVEWEMESENPWLTVTRGETTESDGFSVTRITMESQANESESRMGRIAFSRSGEDVGAYVFMWQFGTELTYDEAGNVLLPADGSKTLEILVPEGVVKGVTAPEDVTVSTDDAEEEGFTKYVFKLGENLSDSRSNRVVNISLNQFLSSETIMLPPVYQDYNVAHGIMTGKGMQLFAESFNGGGDISDWTDSDGNVTLLDDVDMNGVKWETPIGTAERPFNKTIDGKGHAILNLKDAAPLFGHCSEAAVSNLVIDASCSFTKPVIADSSSVWSSVAAQVENTVITACTNNGTVKAGFLEHESMTSVLVAGLVGRVQEGTAVEKSKNYGRVALSVEFSNMDIPVLTGGVVAELSGTLEYCTNNGEVSDESSAKEHAIGGIAARVKEFGAVKSCENYASVSESSANGNVYAGGVAGYALLGEVSNSFNSGVLHITSGAKTVKAGGVAGFCGQGYLDSNSNKGDIVSDGTSKYIFVGGLYGQFDARGAAVELDFAGASSEGSIQLMNMVDNCALGVGGFVGGVKVDVPMKNAEFGGKIEVRLHRDGKGPKITSESACAVGGILGWAESTISLSGCAAKAGSEVRVVCRQGKDSNNADDTPYFKEGINVGGILGYAAKACSVTDSKSMATVRAERSNKRTNSVSCVGGVVGYIAGLERKASVISNCSNSSDLYSGIENRCNPFDSYEITCVGGILGAFDLNPSESSTGGKLSISECSNSGKFSLRRGAAAGIVAYARNATVSGCTSTGNSGDYPNASGGIAGKLENSSVSGCVAKGEIATYNKPHYAGGVVAVGLKTNITGSKFFGKLFTNDDNIAGFVCGGIVAKSDNESKVSDCLYGGSVCIKGDDGKALTIPVTSVNVANYPVGDGTPSVSGIGLWDGILE